MNNIPAYKTELVDSKTKKIQYLFESKGEKSIVKAIEYTLIRRSDGKMIYNLGFGDYNEADGTIFDDINSNNGDMHRVFSTVLNSVPKFFKENEDAGIWVQGSDGAEEFMNLCKIECKKKCEQVCKNFNRRIKTYRYYVDKNFVELSKEYIIFGFIEENESTLVQYIPGTEYTGILIFKKK